MALSVNNNTAAYNTYRNLTTTQGQLSKSLEKLSSGYRINRAADDAAGLAISEGLRSQISGLTQATRNAQDGINVVQTAEGALSETTSILQRMRTLAVQASSDGSVNADAKTNIQAEVTQLKAELDRISTTTKFNGKALLDGSFNTTFQVGANAGETIGVSTGTAAMGARGLGVDVVDVTSAGLYTTATLVSGSTTVTATLTMTRPSTEKDFSGTTFAISSFENLAGRVTFGGKTFDLGTVNYNQSMDSAAALTALNDAAKSAFGISSSVFTATSSTIVFTAPASVAGYTDSTGRALSSSATDLANASPSFLAASGASDSIAKLDSAIKTVSTTRANLGAVQNRLEHTIANLGTATENLTASESSIRDVDMANEMTKFTSKQILAQAGTAMLAQAKNLPQSVLSLLQG